MKIPIGKQIPCFGPGLSISVNNQYAILVPQFKNEKIDFLAPEEIQQRLKLTYKKTNSERQKEKYSEKLEVEIEPTIRAEAEPVYSYQKCMYTLYFRTLLNFGDVETQNNIFTGFGNWYVHTAVVIWYQCSANLGAHKD